MTTTVPPHLAHSPQVPLVSIIIVVYNARRELAALLDSIRLLQANDLEVIVVDGGSQDGTVEYLRTREGQLTYWVSEADRGLYDAMNKAIAHARGKFLLHLNAGDTLLQLPLVELKKAELEGVDVAAFRVQLSSGPEFRPARGVGLHFENTLHHQGTFFRRETFPAYDLQFRIFADFDVNQRLAKAGAVMKTFDRVVSFHATDGVSAHDTPGARKEFFSIIAKNYGSKSLPIAWCLAKWRGLQRQMQARP